MQGEFVLWWATKGTGVLLNPELARHVLRCLFLCRLSFGLQLPQADNGSMDAVDPGNARMAPCELSRHQTKLTSQSLQQLPGLEAEPPQQNKRNGERLIQSDNLLGVIILRWTCIKTASWCCSLPFRRLLGDAVWGRHLIIARVSEGPLRHPQR